MYIFIACLIYGLCLFLAMYFDLETATAFLAGYITSIFIDFIREVML